MKRLMKRRLAIIVPVVIALIALSTLLASRPVPTAHARGVGWFLTLNPPPPFLDGFCPFRVDLTLTKNQEYSKTDTEPDGTVVTHVTGGAKVSLANDVTGKTLDYNVSGPGKITVYPDGSSVVDGTGLGLQFFPPAAQQQFNIPAMAFIQGHFTMTTDTNGNVVGFTDDGAAISDVCAALS